METGRAIFFLSVIALVVSNQPSDSSLLNEAKIWASKFGNNLFTAGNYITKADLLIKEFQDARVEPRNDEQVLEEITREIKNMMNMKIGAVRRLMDFAENRAEAVKEESNNNFNYYNAKCLESTEDPCTNESLKATLTPNSHFWNLAVNTSFSAVHVPTNVYDRAQDVLQAIVWSQELDAVFKFNYHQDPSLSWQYFGSSTGFMRQYPAIQWKQEPVDLYDCRTRSWYIEAANSPKDIVILVDHSGSMTGQRKEIAKHVVNNILDTLGNNDFVNILSFSENTSEVVPCFKDILVQANLANVRTFKQKMENIKTINIANFSYALNKAFLLLQNYRDNDPEDHFRGAQCNQAIMLITDGVPFNYKEIFEEYNWPNITVRVFTYLVGKEVTEVREIKWMACANRGYYVHLSTLAEVREQVLQYIQVMARPLVLNKSYHPIIWTPVYADVEDPKMADWLWQQKESAEQKKIYLEYRANKGKKRKEQIDKMFTTYPKDRKIAREYKLMTSVSMPVYDRRQNATPIANLLGVVGTDVPISEIQKLMNPFKLGVGGYGFIVTNNGYILCHPDLRPVFEGILKPKYNSIDMAEIELVNDGFGHREFNKDLLNLRLNIIEQREPSSATLSVKYHYDDMRRVALGDRKYYYAPIENSTFTVVIAVPKDYGPYRVHMEEELGISRNKREKALAWFEGENWSIHPDWIYCKYVNDTYIEFLSAEEELKHFIEKTHEGGWKWKERPKPPPEGYPTNYSNSSADYLGKDAYYCDRALFLSVLSDAKMTRSFLGDYQSEKDKYEFFPCCREDFKERFGPTVSFVATRSGLTRWKDFDSDGRTEKSNFGEIYNRAIDEVWYKRAVEQYFINKQSFVYSVPFDVEVSNGSLVTASRAIFVEKDGMRAPAAVVGYQFEHATLRKSFFEIMSKCGNGNDGKCAVTCAAKALSCFVLDSNAYIVLSENSKYTGKFFGDVERRIMKLLVEERIYQRVRIYDYQAVCFPKIFTESSGDIVKAPLRVLGWLVEWFMGHVLYMMAEFGFTYAEFQSYEEEGEVCGDNDADMNEPFEPEERDYTINRTRPESCDKKVDLYLLQQNNNNFSREVNRSSRPYVVQPIDNTNLILLLIDCNSLSRDDGEDLDDDITVSTIPEDITESNETLYCEKIINSDLPRKRPKDCYFRHKEEVNITLCGLGNRLPTNWYLLVTSIIALQARFAF